MSSTPGFMATSPSQSVPLEERLSYRCSLISTRITRFITPMLESRYGLTVITWRVMAVIGRYAPLSAKEVAQHTSTDAFFVSRAVEQLVNLEFVARSVDARDRRRSCLELTPAGRTVHRKVEGVINRLEASLITELDAAQREALHTALAYLDAQTQRLQDGEQSWQDFA